MLSRTAPGQGTGATCGSAQEQLYRMHALRWREWSVEPRCPWWNRQRKVIVKLSQFLTPGLYTEDLAQVPLKSNVLISIQSLMICSQVVRRALIGQGRFWLDLLKSI